MSVEGPNKPAGNISGWLVLAGIIIAIIVVLAVIH